MFMRWGATEQETRCNATILQRPAMQQTDLEKGMHTVLGVGIAVPTTSAGTDAGNRHGNRYSTWRGVLFQRRVIQKKRTAKEQRTHILCHFSDSARRGIRFES
jgi:hypothetical protein